jgi:CxxC motif-containing protein (DUF1111 family)
MRTTNQARGSGRCGWLLIAASASAPLAGCAPTGSQERIAASSAALIGDALPGLTADELAHFAEAQDAFNEVEGVTDGLGPVFNEKGCGNCHNVAAAGGSGVQFEVRAGHLAGGIFDPLTAQGGQLFDLFSVTSLPAGERTTIPDCALPPNGEPVPANANVTALRRTTAVFGLGLVDATPDATFTLLALTELPPTRGRAPLVDNLAAGHKTVGKFGWKDQNPTLFQFSGDAYLNEMGITNPQFPAEQVPSGDPATIAPCDGVPVEPGATEDDGTDVQLFTDFMTVLAPPPRGTITAQVSRGDLLFTVAGCDSCHVRTLESGSSPIAALSYQTYHPFSDFLLHDMGSLGDNIGGNGDAGLHEMRTAPLWGLRFVDPTNLLHDGRATSLQDAITRHDGQGALAATTFSLLLPGQKADLLAFLNSL